MSRFVDKLGFFDRRSSPMEEAEDIARDGLLIRHSRAPSPPPLLPQAEAAAKSTTLGQLLKRVGDSRSEASSAASSPSHFTIELGTLTVSSGGGAAALPHNFPLELAFADLSYSVKNSSKKGNKSRLAGSDHLNAAEGNLSHSKTKTLLHSISGEAREGEILAVLGASGSGKSTLIDALANRIAKESLRGSVTLNGEPLESNLLKVISAYVMQDDLLYPMLTVEETLMFSAEFRLPRTLTASKKKSRVQALIDQLGLRAAAKTIIGDEIHRGVSGGERRRVSIGIDIIHDPIVLFLDEPTSGLDSTSAFMVVKVLQRIAHSGSIVIMSVHQPSYRILGLLDRLLFLSRGHTVFYGVPADLPIFFSDFGKPIPENENPAEFALDLIREIEGSNSFEGARALIDHNKQWHSRRTKPKQEKPPLSLKEAIAASISRGKLVSGETSSVIHNMKQN
ncbi:ABC transporter G family member 5-like [Typha latifolia]|uniref:ABC transporter G family member 5-like n=1 Tax=Typha latifolia TaxID=4733 RepID=UPI003C303AF3